MIFLKSFDGSTSILADQDVSMACKSGFEPLLNLIGSKVELLSHNISLSINGTELSESNFASALSSMNNLLFLQVHATMPGGKGGFGNNLRSKSSKVGAKKSTDISACRDLSGRRIRHVQAEKDLRQWIATDQKTDATTVQAAFEKINKGETVVAKECKFGLQCKYRFAECKKLHPVDPELARQEEEKQRLVNLSNHMAENIRDTTLSLGSTDTATIAKSVTVGLLSEAHKVKQLEANRQQVPQSSNITSKALNDYGIDFSSEEESEEDE